MVLLRIYGHFDGCGPAAWSDSANLLLSAANEASHRCMLEMNSVWATEVHAELYEEQDEKLLCSSGPVALGGDEWVCLKTTTTADGGLYKLKTCIMDCSNGWTLCFDVKERPDSTAILTHVRIAWAEPRTQTSTEETPEPESIVEKECGEVLDQTDPEEDGLHPMHRRLLHLYRRPSAELLDPAFWEALVAGSLTLTPAKPFARVRWADGTQALPTKRDLSKLGYGRLPVETFADLDICFSDLAAAMTHLQRRGFPPVFLFLYDQPWQLFLRLFEAVRVLLDSEVRMSLSVFAWALQDASETGPAGNVGSNFGRAHRDKSYADCHFPDTRLGMVTTWVPLVPVTRSSGCMYVVPADKDALLTQFQDPHHLRPDDATCALGEALPCDAGETLVWRANLVHWGAACVDGHPRRSLATAFVVPGVRACEMMETLSEESLAAGLGLETRLRIVVKSLLQYRSWFPDFAGLALD